VQKGILALHADVRRFPAVTLEAERAGRKAHAVASPLATAMRVLEAIIAKQVHAVLAPNERGLALALAADGLLKKDHRVVLAVASGVRIDRARIAENVVTARRDHVPKGY